MTAKTLGLDERYDIVFRVLVEVSDNLGDAANFEEFLKALTTRIVFLSLIFRGVHSVKKEKAITSVFMICKEKESCLLMNLDTLMNNSSMDLMMNN